MPPTCESQGAADEGLSCSLMERLMELSGFEGPVDDGSSKGVMLLSVQ